MNGRIFPLVCVAAAWLAANVAAVFWSRAGSGVGYDRDDSGWIPAVAEASVAAGNSASRPGGFHRRLFTDDQGRTHRYVVFVPYGLGSDDQPPLIVYLNGYGKNGSDGIAPLRDGLAPVIWESKATFPFVVVFPQCTEGGSWAASSPDTERAMAILDATAREFHTDPNRVSLTGLSAGGSGVWTIAGQYLEKFAAIAPMSAGSPDPASLRQFAESQLPIWMFWVRKDDQDLVASNRGAYQSLVDAGLSPRFSEVDGGGHPHDSWDFAFRNPAFLDWLLSQKRNARGGPEPKCVALLNGVDLTGWKSVSGTWTVDADRNVLGESSDDSAPARLELAAEFTDFELLVEFQWVSGDEFGVEFAFAAQPGVGQEISSEPTSGGAPVDVGISPGLVWRFMDASRGSGGLWDPIAEAWLVADSPLAQGSLQRDGWNDLRIHVSRGRISATMNGWEAFRYELQPGGREFSRVTLVTGGDLPATVRFRNLRLRKSF